MFGWRPFLLTVVALLLLAVVVLDVTAAGRKSGSCSTAEKLADARYFAQARDAYATVLRGEPTSACAAAGLDHTTSDQCVRAERIAASDPAEAHRQLLEIAEADPSPGPTSCVWQGLHATATTSPAK